MNENIPEFELGTIQLSGPERVWEPSFLKLHVDRLLRDITALGDLQQWRRQTTLSARLQATSQGMQCVLRLCPAAQAHLDTQFGTRNQRELVKVMLRERNQWLSMLQSAQWQMSGLRLAHALSATLPLVEGSGLSSPDSPPISPGMKRALEQLGRRPEEVRLKSDESDVQLNLPGFEGYTWSPIVVEIVGLPFRTSYGVRIDLTREVRAGDFFGYRVIVHYARLSLPIQEKLDEATRHRSKVQLRGNVGRRDFPATSPLAFLPVND
jgi:hypothetical protein